MSEPSQTEDITEDQPSSLPAAPDPVSVDLSIAEGLPTVIQRRRWTASLIAALSAHGLILMTMTRDPASGRVGAGGTELEAINIEIITSSVLESRHTSATGLAARTEAVDHLKEGSQDAPSTVETADQKQAVQQPTQTPAGAIPDLVIPDAVEEKPPPEPAEIALAIAKERPDVPDQSKPDIQPDRAEQSTPETSVPSEGSEASQGSEAGGAAARGVDAIDTPSQPAAAATSAGAAHEYAKAVIETLARRRPQTTAGVRGTVRIAFTVAHSGEVTAARVLESSGQSLLDEAALTAVRTTRFPERPPGLSKGPLNYDIPYFFR